MSDQAKRLLIVVVAVWGTLALLYYMTRQMRRVSDELQVEEVAPADVLVKETMVLLDKNKEECVAIVRRRVNDPDADKARRQPVPETPESIEGKIVRDALRKRVQENIGLLARHYGDQGLPIPTLEEMYRAEKKLCTDRSLTMNGVRIGGTRGKRYLETALADFIAAYTVVETDFPVALDERRTILKRFGPVIQKAKAEAQIVIQAKGRATQAFEVSESSPSRPPGPVTSFGPEPLSAAERAGVELVAELLDRGTDAWVNGFSGDSRWAQVPASDRSAEILARTGPLQSSTWTLQRADEELGVDAVVFHIEHPSGLDETMLLRLAEGEDGWKITELTTRGERGAGLLDEPASEVESWRQLVPLKNALAAGDLGQLDALFQEAAASAGPAAEVAKLWKAQWSLARFDLGAADKALEGLGDLDRPLARLLPARLAFLRGEFDRLEPAYTDALLRGIDNDQLRLEAAQAFTIVGLEAQAEALLRQLGEMGTRLSTVYYALARLSAFSGQFEHSEQTLATAWQLEPVERQDLFDDPVFAYLATRQDVLDMLEVSSAAEPAVEPSNLREPIDLPAGTFATTSGNQLTLTVLSNEIHLPGGSELAPASAQIENASERASGRHQEAFSRLASFSSDPVQRAMALTHPTVASAISSLARTNQWDRILELTDGAESMVDRIAPLIVKLRAVALDRRGREREARNLLLALVRNDRANERRDPGTLLQLAELFASAGEYDLAIRLIERADAMSPLPGRVQRSQQIRLERDLASDSSTETRGGFRLRYPRVAGKDYAGKLGTVLEAEQRRISKWIPVRGGTPVDVDLYPLQDFRRAYSGAVSVIGIFDGRVRVPFADLHSLHPNVVSILSHELAHALIAAKTNDNAPKWLHEGLAQHVDMVQTAANPIPDLREKNRVLSLPVIEAVLSGMAEPQFTELAYGQAAWAVHFIETEFGVRGIHRLLDAFAEGATTEQALERALGLSLLEFDRRAWAWCETEAPAFWRVELHRYDRELDGLITRSAPEARRQRPKVGRVKEPVRSEAGVSKATVQLWYRKYKAGVSGVSGSLASVLGMVYGRRDWDRGQACHVLKKELEEAARDRSTLSSPDPKVTQNLQQAHASARGLAESCLRGPDETTKQRAARTVKAFQVAREALAAYDLKL